MGVRSLLVRVEAGLIHSHGPPEDGIFLTPPVGEPEGHRPSDGDHMRQPERSIGDAHGVNRAGIEVRFTIIERSDDHGSSAPSIADEIDSFFDMIIVRDQTGPRADKPSTPLQTRPFYNLPDDTRYRRTELWSGTAGCDLLAHSEPAGLPMPDDRNFRYPSPLRDASVRIIQACEPAVDVSFHQSGCQYRRSAGHMLEAAAFPCLSRKPSRAVLHPRERPSAGLLGGRIQVPSGEFKIELEHSVDGYRAPLNSPLERR